jgi:hypothetical protein
MVVQYNPDGKEIASAMDRMVRRFPDAALRFTPGEMTLLMSAAVYHS